MARNAVERDRPQAPGDSDPGAGFFIPRQALSERRDLFHDDIDGRGWLTGDRVTEKCRKEVLASWVWHQADVLCRQERYDQALAVIEPVIELLQKSRSPRLRRAVADTALTIDYQFFLRKEYRKCRAATTVALVDQDYARACREHGTAHSFLNTGAVKQASSLPRIRPLPSSGA